MTRKEWCLAVANACSPSFPGEAATALLGMMPLLANWPDSYFTLKSCREVSCRTRRHAIPSADEISKIFGEIRRDSLPVSVRMGGTSPVGDAITRLGYGGLQQRTPEEIEHVQRVRDEAVAELKAQAKDHAGVKERPKAAYLDKLTLAQMTSPEILEGRPDLRQVLLDHEVEMARKT